MKKKPLKLFKLLDLFYPKEFRSGQYIWNFYNWTEEKGIDILYVEDDELIKIFKKYEKSLK